MADDECIHGFPAGLCDICFPRVRPEPPRRAPGPRVVRAAGARAAAPASAEKPFSLATHRFFHVTHVGNLEAILADGELRAGASPVLDVSSATTRELRAAADLASGRTVADHVAFYASPTATRWIELRDGAPGPHWSDAARSARGTEFVLLGVPGAALGDDVVAADADAAAPATRFGIGQADATAVIRRARAADPELADVELLVVDPVPVTAIATISVANEPLRDAVRQQLALAGVSPRVAVYPPWFVAG